MCPTHPPYGGAITTLFVKEQRRKILLAGVLYPRTPKLLLYSYFMPPFCQGIAPKNFAGKAR